MSSEGNHARQQGRGPLSLDDRIPVRGEAMVHEVSASDETVLFTRERGELLLLNDVGAGVWYLINGRRSVAEIVNLVAEHFPDAEQQVGNDVLAFLGSLEDAGAIRFA